MGRSADSGIMIFCRVYNSFQFRDHHMVEHGSLLLSLVDVVEIIQGLSNAL